MAFYYQRTLYTTSSKVVHGIMERPVWPNLAITFAKHYFTHLVWSVAKHYDCSVARLSTNPSNFFVEKSILAVGVLRGNNTKQQERIFCAKTYLIPRVWALLAIYFKAAPENRIFFCIFAYKHH
jgi:hypothetical protein